MSEPSTPAPSPDPRPSSLPPDTSRQTARGFWIAAAVLFAVFGVYVWNNVDSGPEGAVVDYFDAIKAKDVETALTFVEPTDMPVGEQAAFLDPNAISTDWELVGTERVDGTEVRVELGHGKERLTTDLTVRESDGEWRIDEALVEVEVKRTALSFLRVNDKAVDLDRLHAFDHTLRDTNTVTLFPGWYRFHGRLPVATDEVGVDRLLINGRDYDMGNPLIPAPRFEYTDEAVKALQREVDQLIDTCADLTVRRSPSCPFGVEASYRDSDGEYSRIRDITWTVKERPKVTVAPSVSVPFTKSGLPVEIVEPGEISLAATASTDADQAAKLRLTCEFSTERLWVSFDVDGQPRLFPEPMLSQADLGLGWDLDTCSGKRGGAES